LYLASDTKHENKPLPLVTMPDEHEVSADAVVEAARQAAVR
jgi:hypothetical protein